MATGYQPQKLKHYATVNPNLPHPDTVGNFELGETREDDPQYQANIKRLFK